jgi:hypothetical protein
VRGKICDCPNEKESRHVHREEHNGEENWQRQRGFDKRSTALRWFRRVEDGPAENAHVFCTLLGRRSAEQVC